MQDFLFYLTEGWRHIISADALDHQLFILALLGLYSYSHFRKLLWLVTAFTVGHSITLALSVMKVFSINTQLVEILIPVTLIITCFVNLSKQKYNEGSWLRYCLVLLFGLIHGLGFANTLQFMLARTQSFGTSLFGFNVGLELGQLLVVAVILLVNYLWLKKIRLSLQIWNYLTSGLALCVALYILYSRF